MKIYFKIFWDFLQKRDRFWYRLSAWNVTDFLNPVSDGDDWDVGNKDASTQIGGLKFCSFEYITFGSTSVVYEEERWDIYTLYQLLRVKQGYN